MAQKKFGSFGGVFTPSILTILGVIMYMRLPWIVGQAGLFLTIGVILIAHLVSITTGLSVSSIATDKKVKAGGTYYIISRSLGLPIGGTLGIALFFGLSLSISLYLIGFSESFLAFWDIPITKNSIRIAGTAALLFVGTLTFISTSLAIKTQYIIMSAIILSLVTIIFGSHDFTPAEPLLQPIEDSAPIILLFAIFFPAVTGFEAGVSMSGDLEDPKRSIPVGTISAILVGLLVYIGLAFFFSYTVSADQLANNPNILLDISFFPPLLVAGIWGATISSAIGSILGAPRILQAISLDSITPKIFSKGYGSSNEPRNALLLTFIIAEVGILIGELNLIARIVSMFFITTYGFLNLSSTIEKLASTDFRPSFKIPAWVSIIGAVVSIVLMLELDFIALIGAVIIMGGIFLYLKNKELTLESGDTWEGVWSSLLRTGLNRLNRTEIKQRNWRPNIILFSGGSDKRPHLIEFGRWLVKKRGILSSFDLTENKSAPQLVRRPKASIKEKEGEFEGIFTRQVEVNNIYNGMETITKLYGFAGIEPNTVMLGWGRESKDPLAFSKLLRIYQKLDYNIFILDYDKKKMFGNRKTIDLWWRGSNNNANLALTIIKFLLVEDDWNEAVARIFIITNDSSIHNRVYKNVKQILEDQRIEAEINIINNSIENKDVKEIIRLESSNSDLVILGLPDIDKDKNIISQTDAIISEIGSVLLIHASSFFKPIYIGIEENIKVDTELLTDGRELKSNLPVLNLPSIDVLAKPINEIRNIIDNEINHYSENYLSKLLALNSDFSGRFMNLIEKSFDDLYKNIDLKQIQKSKRSAAKTISGFLYNSQQSLTDYQDLNPHENDELLSAGIQNLITNISNIRNNFNEELVYEIDVFQNRNLPGLLRKLFKLDQPRRIKVRIHDLIESLLLQIKKESIIPHLSRFGVHGYQFISELHKLFDSVNDSLLKIETLLERGDLTEEHILNEKKKFTERIEDLDKRYKNDFNNLSIDLFTKIGVLLQAKSEEIEHKDANKIFKHEIKVLSNNEIKDDQILNLPSKLAINQKLVSNFFVEEIFIKNVQHRVKIILERTVQELFILIDDKILDDLEKLKLYLHKVKEEENPSEFEKDIEGGLEISQIINPLTEDFNKAIENVPEQMEILDEESFQNLEEKQFGEIALIEINLRRYLNFIIENEIIDQIQDELNTLSINVNKSIEIGQDVIRFTNYNISQINDDYDFENEPIITVIERSYNRIVNEINVLEQSKTNFINNYNEILQSAFDKLNPYLISKSVGEFKRAVRVSEGLEFVTSFQKRLNRVKQYFSKIVVDLVYKRSEGVLLAKKINQSSPEYETETERVLKIVNYLEPEKEVLNSLPFYYKQLYLSKHFKSNEFLIIRKKELSEASEAINNFKKGYRGALLVMGDRLSGKTTLSNSIAQKHFHVSKIYQIHPIDGGSIEENDFEKQFSHALKQEGNPETILNSLPANSTVILNDLELWWERSLTGFKVIERIVRLIEQHSSKIFFIINCSTHSYHLLNRIFHLENIFIKTVECQPFDAEELKEAVLLRHKSSGLKFLYDDQSEEELSNFSLANLFNRYFDITDGNIGLSLVLWLSHINKVRSNEIIIDKPSIVSPQSLYRISDDWLTLIEQFTYHKQLNVERLSRILSKNNDEVEFTIESLKRSGLISEVSKNIYHINPYIQHVILKMQNSMGTL